MVARQKQITHSETVPGVHTCVWLQVAAVKCVHAAASLKAFTPRLLSETHLHFTFEPFNWCTHTQQNQNKLQVLDLNNTPPLRELSGGGGQRAPPHRYHYKNMHALGKRAEWRALTGYMELFAALLLSLHNSCHFDTLRVLELNMQQLSHTQKRIEPPPIQNCSLHSALRWLHLAKSVDEARNLWYK